MRPLRIFASGALAMCCVMSPGRGEKPAPILTPSGHPASAQFLHRETLRKLGEELTVEAEENGRDFAFATLFVNETHGGFLTRRTATGEAELHAGVSDYWTIIAGEGEVVIGGEIVAAEEKAPGESRGASIKGGARTRVRAGDQINIPPGVAHQIILGKDQSITVLIVKVNLGQYPRALVK